MSYECEGSECCEDCRYLSYGDGMWPDECELEGRSLEGHDLEAKPSWCPMSDEDY